MKFNIVKRDDSDPQEKVSDTYIVSPENHGQWKAHNVRFVTVYFPKWLNDWIEEVRSKMKTLH